MKETSELSAAQEGRRFWASFLLPTLFVAALCFFKMAETWSGISLVSWGIYPRTREGLIGILTAPLVHGDWEHLFSNAVPLIALGGLAIHTYRIVAIPMLLFIYLMSGLGIWLMGRTSHHIGASGIVYGLAFFIFFSGIFRRDTRSMALAAIVVMFYGSMVWGLLPLVDGISWEGHIAGALAGVASAYYARNINLPPAHQWADDTANNNNNDDDPLNAKEYPFWIAQQSDLYDNEYS